MILVRNLRLAPGEDSGALIKKAAGKLRIPAEDIEKHEIIKRSLDCRRKSDIHYIYSVALGLKKGEGDILRRAKDPDVSRYAPPVYAIPKVSADAKRPVIVGFGPGGMFAALVLAEAGARPIVIERGQEAGKRQKAVEALRAGKELEANSNVQFGEGGAGTFSDGKLNTGIKDPRMGWMLRTFVKYGAPEDIVYDAKPHIGTDILINVVQNIRRAVIAMGGEVRFETRMKELVLEDGRVKGILVESSGGEYEIECENVILAIGHSARDTFEALHAQGVPMEPKPFSMGVRIEHRQKDIDLAQYGRERGSLPAADYSLNVHLPDGTSAYTFCMCPGGQVFAAASEQGGVVTNGMSYRARNGENANAALLVTLSTEDFPGRGVLSGMYWQREIEQAAYDYGGGNYCAPAQLVGDFLAGRKSTGAKTVKPTYCPGVIWGDIREVLPERMTGVIANALPELGKKLRGFDSADAVMTAPETRSSSPVRILRDAALHSPIQGLIPCGEGAGYAGGISSAACDGMRCAEAVLKSLDE